MCRYVVWLVGVELWWKSVLSCGGGRDEGSVHER